MPIPLTLVSFHTKCFSNDDCWNISLANIYIVPKTYRKQSLTIASNAKRFALTAFGLILLFQYLLLLPRITFNVYGSYWFRTKRTHFCFIAIFFRLALFSAVSWDAQRWPQHTKMPIFVLIPRTHASTICLIHPDFSLPERKKKILTHTQTHVSEGPRLNGHRERKQCEIFQFRCWLLLYFSKPIYATTQISKTVSIKYHLVFHSSTPGEQEREKREETTDGKYDDAKAARICDGRKMRQWNKNGIHRSRMKQQNTRSANNRNKAPEKKIEDEREKERERERE